MQCVRGSTFNCYLLKHFLGVGGVDGGVGVIGGGGVGVAYVLACIIFFWLCSESYE